MEFGYEARTNMVQSQRGGFALQWGVLLGMDRRSFGGDCHRVDDETLGTYLMLTRSDIFQLVNSAKHMDTILYPLGQPTQKNLLDLVRLMAQKIEEELGKPLEEFLMPRAPLVEQELPEGYLAIDWDKTYPDSVKLNSDLSVTTPLDEMREIEEYRRMLK